jgi:hypothetical protein
MNLGQKRIRQQSLCKWPLREWREWRKPAKLGKEVAGAEGEVAEVGQKWLELIIRFGVAVVVFVGIIAK